jgi:DNA-directed RNA polymerase specialized sigma24 family protein
MKPSRDEAERPRRFAQAESIADLYERIGPFLLRILVRQFSIPADEAEALLPTIFTVLPSDVADQEKWLIAATCNSASAWRQQRARDRGETTGGPSGATAAEIAAANGLLSATRALAAMPPQGREAVRLRFRENKTYAEIAAELDISEFYAQRLIEKTLARAWALQRRQQRPDEPES